MAEKQQLPTKFQTIQHQLSQDFYESLTPYKNNALLQGLFQFALCFVNPIIAGTAMAAQTAAFTWAANRERKWKVLVEELGGWEQLSSELLEDADFLHCFKRVIDAVETTQSHEKIRYFARLLKASTQTGMMSSIDEYEEYLSILRELSCQEFLVLSILDKYEKKFPLRESEGPVTRSQRFWDKFITELIEDVKIPENEINTILLRLIRTGCYEASLRNTMGTINLATGYGRLTSTYRRLKQIIEKQQ